MTRFLSIIVVALVAIGTCHAKAHSAFRVEPQNGGAVLVITAQQSGRHVLEIDDADGFRSPVVREAFFGTRLRLQTPKLALIPGVRYQARLDGRQRIAFQLETQSVSPETVTCSTLRTTWEQSGRFYTGVTYSQLRWNDSTRQWDPVLPAVPIGESIYNVEFFLRPALSAARACGDLQTMDEIALYYLAMLNKTETVSSLLSRPNLIAESARRLRSSNPSARTFLAPFGSAGVGEGELYNAQWLHPAALLMRLITELPASQRTPGLRAFVRQMTPFLVRDQLLRLLFEQDMPHLGGRAHRGRVAHWELAMQGLQGGVHWETAMSDIDLWLLSSAAEVLGAQANDPDSLGLTPAETTRLRQAIATGVRFFQAKRTYEPSTKSFSGETVGSASYFNGDYDGLSEMRGTAVTSSEFPGTWSAAARAGASWDTAHTYRIAIFLRSLYENRKATGSTFPHVEDLRLVVNQYLYRVFEADYHRPLFRNNFDGSDGWFRVGYNGPRFGQPPSHDCNMHDANRLCMAPGTIMGWAELSFVNPDLARLETSLLRLGASDDPGDVAFCDRYYFWLAPFRTIISEGKPIYGGALYSIAGESADRITRS